MERVEVNNMNNDSNKELILAIGELIKETNLDEFEELKDSINDINLEIDKIISEEEND